jgi:hypothetical protein
MSRLKASCEDPNSFAVAGLNAAQYVLDAYRNTMLVVRMACLSRAILSVWMRGMERTQDRVEDAKKNWSLLL